MRYAVAVGMAAEEIAAVVVGIAVGIAALVDEMAAARMADVVVDLDGTPSEPNGDPLVAQLQEVGCSAADDKVADIRFAAVPSWFVAAVVVPVEEAMDGTSAADDTAVAVVVVVVVAEDMQKRKTRPTSPDCLP